MMLSRLTFGNLRSFISFPIVRNLSSVSSVTGEDDTKVIVADDGKTLVCWHPEPEFSYEHTLPLPHRQIPSKNIIRALDEVDQFKGLKEEFVREKLMKLTYTTKHRWFPRLQKKKAKKTPMDRPYL